MAMKYIGARYMPKFMGTYDATMAYEALSVVDNGAGTSYVSNKPAPAGTPLTDTEYWAVYGASSGAIIDLETRMTAAENNIHTLQLNVGYVNVKEFGAIGDGVTDDTDAIKSAINNAGSTGVVYFPQGLYLISDNITLDNITLMGCGILDGTVPFNNGSTIIIKASTFDPFTLGYNVTITGLGFYYPDQNGSTSSPIVYPPTFNYNAAVNIIFKNCIFYNAYIGISNRANNSAIGRIIFDSIYAYCVETFLAIRNAQDTITLSNSFITAGIFQDVALTGDQYLGIYTANYGKAITIDTSADDFKISNSLIWGYAYGIYIKSSGSPNMMKINNNHFDGVQSALFSEAGSSINNLIIDGCEFFTYSSFYTGTVKACIQLSSSSVTTVLISDCIAEVVNPFISCLNALRDIHISNVDVHGVASDQIGMIIRAVTANIENTKITCAPLSSNNTCIILVDVVYAIIQGVMLERGITGIMASNMTALTLANILAWGQTYPYSGTNIGTEYKSNCSF